MAARAGCAVHRDLYRRHHANSANVNDHRQVSQREDRVDEIRGHRGGAINQFFITKNLHHREARRHASRVRAVGVAVEKLNAFSGARVGNRVVDIGARRHRAHRLRAVGHGLRHAQ